MVDAQAPAPAGEQDSKKAARAIWEELDREDAGDDVEAAAGDSSHSNDKPEDTREPAPKQAEQQPTDAPKQVAGSPLSDEERALLRQIPDMVNMVKTTAGRVGSLQSELSKIGQRAAASTGAGERPTTQAIDKAAASPEKWEALKKDFPDWAEGVESLISSRIPSAQPAPTVDVEAIRQKIAGDFEAKRQEDALEVVSLFDPEWKAKSNTAEFRQWIASQPAEYQQVALNTWKPSEIIRTMRDFDASRKPAPTEEPPQQRPSQQRRLAASVIPRGNAKLNLSKPESEMTPQEYWAHLERQDQQRQRA